MSEAPTPPSLVAHLHGSSSRRLSRLLFSVVGTLLVSAALLGLSGCWGPATPSTGDGETDTPQVSKGVPKPGEAGRPPLIPLEDFFDNPRRAGARVSPDGKWLTFLQPWAPEENQPTRLNVFITPVPEDPSQINLDDARQLTFSTERGISSYFWTRDSRYILYSQDKHGDEDYHIYRVDPTEEKPEPVDLTPYKKIRVSVIDLPKGNPDEMIILMNKRDEQRRFMDPYRLKISTGEVELLHENPGDIAWYYTDLEGKVRAAYARVAEGNVEIRVRDGEDDEFRVLAEYHRDDDAGLVGFAPDGDYLYFTSAKDANATRLVKLDLKSGKETEVIASDPQYDISGVQISDITDKLIAVAFERARVEWQPLDEDFGKLLKDLEKVRKGDVIFVDSTADERKLIVAFQAPDDPVETFYYDRDTGKAVKLYRVRHKLNPEHLSPMEPIQFTARDGLAIHGYLTLPKGIKPEKLPTVLLVHGGPWSRDSWGYSGAVQFLANRGFAVLQINFRGSTGYGKEFLKAGDKEWGRKMLFDLVDGAKWAVEQGYSDPQRLAIYGGSYGGYATLSALAFEPDVFAVGVSSVGPSSLITLMENMPPYWETFRETIYKRVGHLEEERELLIERSPLFHVDKMNAPLFVAQGANDPRVTEVESEQIVEALRKKGHEVVYQLELQEGHGFANPENRLQFNYNMMRFLQRHLLGEVIEPENPVLEAMNEADAKLIAERNERREKEAAEANEASEKPTEEAGESEAGNEGAASSSAADSAGESTEQAAEAESGEQKAAE